MPKLYEYFDIVVYFFSREHEPIHVHGKYQDREMSKRRFDIKIIREPVDEQNIEVIDIVRAEYLADYKIHLVFSDGRSHTVDFEPFLRNAKNPAATQFLDVQKFKHFRIVHGNLDWNDYEMCFAIEDLYNNEIDLELSTEDRRTLEDLSRQLLN